MSVGDSKDNLDIHLSVNPKGSKLAEDRIDLVMQDLKIAIQKHTLFPDSFFDNQDILKPIRDHLQLVRDSKVKDIYTQSDRSKAVMKSQGT